MRVIGIISRKELRAYFDSPVALIFLGVFVLGTLVSFFGYSPKPIPGRKGRGDEVRKDTLPL